MNEPAENTQVTRWRDILSKIRNLNIIASATWDTFPSGKYITDVVTYEDAGLRPLHYESDDLEDMIEELEVYYLRAKNKDQIRKFRDIVSTLWWTWVGAFVFLHTVAYIVIPIFVIAWLSDAGLLPEIMEAVRERF